jgi:hypothetical protein
VDPRDVALRDATQHLGDVDIPVEARRVPAQVVEQGTDERLRALTQRGRGDSQPQRARGQRTDLRGAGFVETHTPQELLLELGELGVGQDLGVDALIGIGPYQRRHVEAGVHQPTADQHHRRHEHEAHDEEDHQEKRRPRPRPPPVAAARRPHILQGRLHPGILDPDSRRQPHPNRVVWPLSAAERWPRPS